MNNLQQREAISVFKFFGLKKMTLDSKFPHRWIGDLRNKRNEAINAHKLIHKSSENFTSVIFKKYF